MRRRIGAVIVWACLLGVGWAFAAANADDEKTPSVKEIMKLAHKGPKAALGSIGRGLNTATPNWDEIQAKTKELVKLGTALTKNEPPKGDQASWDRFTKKYLASAKD